MSAHDHIDAVKKTNRREFMRGMVRYPLMGALACGGIFLVCRSQSTLSAGNKTSLPACKECSVSRFCLWKQTK
jgi:hypothetical protein